MFTPKQVRNGADQGAAGHNTAVANMADMPDIPLGAAESAAAEVMAEAHALMTMPAGSGVDGHMVGLHGSVTEWDSGLAINDVEGGMSG